MKPSSRMPGLARTVVAVGVIGLTVLLLHTGDAFAQQARAAVDSAVAGWAVIAAAITASVFTIAAGYAVAMVGSAAVGAVAEKPELIGRVLILVGLAEGIAIYGLIVAVLILNRVG